MNYSIGWTSIASEFQSSRVTTMCFFLIQTKRTNVVSQIETGWWQLKYSLFSLRPLGKFIPFWLYNIFHKCVGWNHQPKKCPSGFSRRKQPKKTSSCPHGWNTRGWWLFCVAFEARSSNVVQGVGASQVIFERKIFRKGQCFPYHVMYGIFCPHLP